MTDDPAPFEPDADDIVEIEDEIRRAVEEMRTEVYAGVRDRDVCGRCRYRSICPDSAAPGEPIWPSVEAEDDDPRP